MKSKLLVLIDNGHGVDTHGKRSPIWEDGRQLFEWEFNRDVAQRIYLGLDEQLIKSVLLVPEEQSISLRDRCKRVNDWNKWGKANGYKTILVSVHANAGKGTGWEAWVFRNSKKSIKLAKYFYDAAKEYLPNFTLRKGKHGPKESHFYILKHTSCPALLTENLFMDTYSDCNYLLSTKGRENIAQLHISAIKKYRNEI